jgi:tetratricopeptide (TPR) repeat protein
MRSSAFTLALTMAATATAAATTPADRFDEATALIADHRPAEAAAVLVALADADPQASIAADALLLAAQLREDQLGDPVGAAALYRRLVRDYPDSRAGLAAGRRLAPLEASLGPGDAGAAPLAAFTDIKQRIGERGDAESIRRAQELVAAHPDWAGLPDALLWLAETHARTGDHAAARRRFLEVAERWPERAFGALEGAGQAALAAGDFDGAEALFERLPVGGDDARARVRADGLAEVAKARLRHRLYLAGHGVIAAVLLGLLLSLRAAAGSWRAAGRALARPPTEILYMVPVAVLLVGAALTGHQDIAPAVAIILVGGLVITWVSGAGLATAGIARGRPTRPRLRALVHAAASATAVVALCWIALHRTRLIDMIIETVRFGPET